MKPKSINIDNLQRGDSNSVCRSRIPLPVTDYHYHANAITGFAGHCGNSSAKNFRHISDDYFEKEAPGNYVLEAGFFALIVATVAVPLVQSATTAMEFLRAIGTL